MTAHSLEWDPPDFLDGVCFAVTNPEIVGLEMTDGNCVMLAPANEKQVSGERMTGVARLVANDLNAVRGAVTPFECGRAAVSSPVTPKGIGIAFAEIRLEKLSQLNQCTRTRRLRPLTASRKTLPVRNATFAGRSASLRIR